MDSRTLDPDPYTRIHQLHEMVLAAVLEFRNSEDVGRVAELERQVQELHDEGELARDRVAELERQLAEARDQRDVAELRLRDALERSDALEQVPVLDPDCYVAREVPWSDVAAGMMTIARDGTPWMVERWLNEVTIVLRNGEKPFHKNPEPGEIVRVLVPYVTPEQAEALVKNELGGVQA